MIDPPAVVDTLELRMAGLRRRVEGLELMVANVAAAQADRQAAPTHAAEATPRHVVVDNLRRLQLGIAPVLLDAARLLAAAEDAELELGQP